MLTTNGEIRTVMSNPLAQFGQTNAQYLGATILPERTVETNAYREMGVRYRTVIATDGTRYSPAQKRSGGILSGSFLVELGDSDIATEFTGADYDGLLRIIERAAGAAGTTNENLTMEAAAQLLGWLDTAVNLALVEFNEKQRWEAIVTGQVARRSDNGLIETVQYPTASGHRIAAGGTWSSDAYDPMLDILAVHELLADKGYGGIGRIIMTTADLTKFSRNVNIARRAGRVTAQITGTNTIREYAHSVSRADVNAVMSAEGLPEIEVYDRKYFAASGTRTRFLPTGSVVFLGETGRSEEIDISDVQPEAAPLTVFNTLGYTAIGTPVGHSQPGRVVDVAGYTNKPPRIEAEGWQTSLPIILDPEAFVVLNSVA